MNRKETNTQEAYVSYSIHPFHKELMIPLKGWLIQDAEQQSFLLDKHHHNENVHGVEKLRQYSSFAFPIVLPP